MSQETSEETMPFLKTLTQSVGEASAFESRNAAELFQLLDPDELRELVGSPVDFVRRYKELERQNSELRRALAELKSFQVRLVHDEKMDSLGVLTAGILHEINNPVNAVLGSATALDQELDRLTKFLASDWPTGFLGTDKSPALNDGDQRADVGDLVVNVRELLTTIHDEGAHCSQITEKLRVFACAKDENRELESLEDNIEATLVLLNHRIEGCITVVKNYQKIPRLECYPGQLNQAFMNLLLNAIEALEKGSQAQNIIEICSFMEDEAICITISDTGPGVPEQLRSRIFEPFFTTKDVGEGLGLGLAISHRIVEQHGGRIEAKAAPGGGSCFLIKLPLTR